MVYVRIVLMAVGQRDMIVRMRVRLGAVPGEVMTMEVVLIVRVGMSMRQRLVSMLVPVTLGEVQSHAGCHQHRCQPEQARRRLPEQCKRGRDADERSGCEISSGPCGAEVPQGHHEQGEAHPIAE